jgi:hypothetical protein
MRKSDKYNTPYDRDMADIARRKQNKTSSKSKLGWFGAWLLALVLFW